MPPLADVAGSVRAADPDTVALFVLLNPDVAEVVLYCTSESPAEFVPAEIPDQLTVTAPFVQLLEQFVLTLEGAEGAPTIAV